jgi:hypothetical protein
MKKLTLTAATAAIALLVGHAPAMAQTCNPGQDCGVIKTLGAGFNCVHFTFNSNNTGVDVTYGIPYDSYTNGFLKAMGTKGTFINVTPYTAFTCDGSSTPRATNILQ